MRLVARPRKQAGSVEAAVERFTQCPRASRVAGYRPGEAQALRCPGQSHRVLGAALATADALRNRRTAADSGAFELGAAALAQYKARTGSVKVPRAHVVRLEDGTEVRLGVWITKR
jgi:hypothetical protein